MLETLINSNQIGNSGGGYEPQRMNSIVLVIPNLGGINTNNELTLGLQMFTVPQVLGQSSMVQIQRGLTSKKFAGNVQFGQMTVEFDDYVDRSVAEQLIAWRSLVYDPITKQIRAASVYKRDCVVQLIPPAGSPAPTRMLTIKGVWPIMAPDFGNADLGSDELTKLTCQFEYDDCLPSSGFSRTALNLAAGLTFIAGAIQSFANS